MRLAWRGAGYHTRLAVVVALVCLMATACDATGTTTPTNTPSPTASPTSGPLTFAAQWQRPTNGPTLVHNFAFVPSNPAVGYACVASPASTATPTSSSGTAQLLTTADGGVTWSRVSTSPVTANTCTVFADASKVDDLFVEQDSPASGVTPGATPGATPHATPHATPGTSGSGPAVWRSQDHGVTWTAIKTLTFAKGHPRWDNIVVVGSRLVASAGSVCATCAPLANDLFASDDGGQTWSQIGQTIADQGVQVGAVSAAGSMLFVSAVRGCDTGSSCLTATPTSDRAGTAPLDASTTAPNSTYQPSYFFSSADGGITWAPEAIPGSHATALAFTKAASGNGYYGLAVDNGDTSGDIHLYLSTDGGLLWRSVPSLADEIGSLSGHIDVTTSSLGGNLAVTPDGGVVVSVAGTFPGTPTQGNERGVFYLPAITGSGGVPSTWRPVALGNATMGWQVVPGPTGARLWAIDTTATTGPDGAPLVYLDL